MVQGRSAVQRQQVSIRSTGNASANWTATTTWPGSDSAINLSATSGATPGSLTVALVDSVVTPLAPGTYSGSINIQNTAGIPVTVAVRVQVAAALPQAGFTYIQGPNGCNKPDGYLDDAICVVTDEKPPGTFKAPSTGGSYRDPNFGAPVRILSSKSDCRHAYSTPSPIGAQNKYVLAACSDGLQALDAATGSVVYKGLEGDINLGVYWDAVDDEVYYFLSATAVKKRDLRAGKTTTLVDYATDGHRFTGRLTAGGTGDLSKDNWLAVLSPDQKQICALDLGRVATYCGSYSTITGVPVGFVDYPLMSKGVDKASGKRYVMLMANPSMAVFSVNAAAGRLDLEYRGPENPENFNGKGNLNRVCETGENCFGAPHVDSFEDSGGIQYLVGSTETERTLPGTPWIPSSSIWASIC